MKKIVILLIALLSLSGCFSIDSKLDKLGYTEKQIEIIKQYDEETQKVFLAEKLDKYTTFMDLDGFNPENLFKYAKYADYFSSEKIIELVNRGILNDDSIKSLDKLYNSDYFIKDNEDLYLQYLNEYDDVRDVLEVVNTKRYLPLYSNIETSDVSYDYLLLVNKYYQLPSDYEPDDLVQIEDIYGIGLTRQITYDAYKELYEEASNLGYDLQICSAYRSFDYQDGLYNKYLQIDPKDVVDTYSARPGHSEHQSGLCLDVTVPGYSLDDFYQTEASDWLKENCYKYGFIIRYGYNKEDITGYQAEPWQIRYVGKEVAKDIYERDITFDEYWACFIKR